MSVRAIRWAMEQTAGSAGAKAVLVVLADYADDDGCAFPSQAAMAARAEMGVRTLRRHLEQLEGSGLVKRERRVGVDGERSSDGYQLALHVSAEMSLPARLAADLPAKLAPSPTGQIGRFPPEAAKLTTGQIGQGVNQLTTVVVVNSSNAHTRGDSPEPTGRPAEPIAPTPEPPAVVLPLRPRSQVERGALIAEIIRTANRGMKDNPKITDFRPILVGHGTSQQVVGDWLDAGIPADTIRSAVYAAAKRYPASGPRDQIYSLAYFAHSVAEAHETERTDSIEVPNDSSNRAGRRPDIAPATSRGEAPRRATGTDSSRRSGWIIE